MSLYPKLILCYCFRHHGCLVWFLKARGPETRSSLGTNTENCLVINIFLAQPKSHWVLEMGKGSLSLPWKHSLYPALANLEECQTLSPSHVLSLYLATKLCFLHCVYGYLKSYLFIIEGMRAGTTVSHHLEFVKHTVGTQ